MKEEIFISNEGTQLCVVSNRSNIQLFLPTGYEDGSTRRKLTFERNKFEELLKHIETEANKIWKSLTPQIADSPGADYDEYFDRAFGNNGYLTLGVGYLMVDGPYGGENKLYQFNKRKIESFLYDVNQLLCNW